MKHIQWSLSDSYRQRYSDISQGLISFVNVAVSDLAPRVLAAQQAALEQIEHGSAAIEQSIERYDSHFREWGSECPLVRQFAKTRKKGLPRINPLVDTLLLCEMRFGVLMGVHDLGQTRGDLVYDCARPGETFQGMRAPIICGENEIVIRDEQSVIASYIQGADRRTCVTGTTEHVVIFVFGAPHVGRDRLEEAMATASSILKPLSASSLGGFSVLDRHASNCTDPS